MTTESVFKGYGVEVRIAEEDDFLKIKETLTRIGVAAKEGKKLYQSCHILHKQGKYAIIHFKELFALDGKPSTFTEDDKGRRNEITRLLQEWKLLKVVDPEEIKSPTVPMSQIKVIPFKDKANWELVSKYSIGVKK